MSNARQQLEVFHDPFSTATEQPKIPDGKSVRSLGISNQSVTEIRNGQGEDVIDMFLFSGQNCGAIVFNVDSDLTVGTRNYRILGFGTEEGGLTFNISSAPVDGKNNVTQNDGYAYWRVVSAGARLSLINAAEEDDGWWEAVRLSRSLQYSQYGISTTDLRTSSAAGCVAPLLLNNAYASLSIADEPSYCTGLLRDLKHYQFDLHGVLDHHDYTRCIQRIMLEQDGANNNDVIYDSANTQAFFETEASTNARDVVEQYIDQGYDMIYIRLHCRTNNGTAGQEGSSIHVNLVSNQEIQFDESRRESKYETLTSNVGVNAVSKHATLRRLRGAAAHRVY